VSVHARIIAASNTDLDRLSSAGGFRQDLLYRLNVVNVHLPPLRDRREDIALLAGHFLKKYAPGRAVPMRLSPNAARLLDEYSWPGNVRELENTIERAVTLGQGSVISEDDLPPALRRSPDNPAGDASHPATMFAGLPTLDEMERRYVRHVLQASAGNRTHASEVLGINRRTLYRMAARLGIDL
jgi:DNA-binding NtrC family response regulator